jgi:PAS domain S-box-containing protein
MDEKKIKILVVEDNPGDARLIQEMLAESAEAQFVITHTDKLSKALDYLANEHYDIILLDLGLPDSFGLDTFAKIHSRKPQIPIIILTGLDDKNLALKAVRKGAQDYLIKGQCGSALLINSIRYSIERLKADEALRESESRFRSVFDNASVGIALVAKEGNILAANQALCNFLGVPQQQIIGKQFSEFTYSEDLASDKDLFESLLQSNLHGYTIDKRYARKDGHIIWCHQSVSTVRDIAGSLLYTVVVCEDITERKKTEEERKIKGSQIQQE